MSQSICDTIVEFELAKVDLIEILEWLYVLEPETWWNERNPAGRIVGISFKHESDAIIFRLRFGL